MSKYDKIKVLKGLEGIQVRPGMYVGDVSNLEGLMNCLWEVIANSFDEHVAGFGDLIKLFILERRKEQIYVITDYGRGIPNSWNEQEGKLNLELVFTYIHSGGKFEHDSYAQSSGLHGVGLTAVNALSSFLICTSIRPERIVTLSFINGKLINQSVVENKFKISSGTRIIFKPNKKYLVVGKLDKRLLVRKLYGLTYVKPNLKIRFKFQNKDSRLWDFMISSKEGLIDLFNWKVKDLNPITTPNFRLHYRTENGQEANIIFNWYKTSRNHIQAYTNGTEQTLGGSHVNQFLQELKNLFGKQKVSLNNQEIREGLHAVISIMISEPQYSSQTKEKLSASEGRDVVKKCFHHNYSYFIAMNNQIKKLSHHLKFLSKKKQEYLSSIHQTDSKSTLGLSFTGKLLDCLSRDTSFNELMICEGDSAGATAKSARDKHYQAIMPIRGKILNVQRTTLRRALNSETIRNLITAIGTRFGKDYNYESLRYGKIILMTDADEDGKQIQALLIALFYKYLPDIIRKGHLKIVRAPLFKLEENRRLHFFFSRNNLERHLLLKNDFSLPFISYFQRLDLKKEDDAMLMFEFVVRLRRAGKNLREIAVLFQKHFNLPCKVIFGHTFCVIRIGYHSMRRYLIFRKDQLVAVIRLMSLDDRDNLFEEIYRSINLNKKDIVRYKGLGQMDFEELWDQVMNPENRQLITITYEDSALIAQKFDYIMGNKPWYRKWLIGQDDKLDIHDLDI